MMYVPVQTLDETNRWDGNEAAIALGEKLFYESDISPQRISCASCHDPQQGFADGQIVSAGVEDTPRHSPGLWNTADQRWFFWDGKCDTLWCQAISPLESQIEMNSSRTELAFFLTERPAWKNDYETIFGSLPDVSTWPRIAKPSGDSQSSEMIAWEEMPLRQQREATQVLVNVAKSIAAFEGTLRPRSAPIDQFVATFLENEEQALQQLTPSEEEGLRLFVGAGDCHLCHSGSLFSDLEFHNIGLGPREWLSEIDYGRYEGISMLRSNPFNATSEWSDAPNGERARRIDRLSQTTEQLGQFKTPSLRELSSSAPYMHGGHFATLEDVVRYYSELPETPLHGHREDFVTPKNWTDEQIESMAAFLLFLSSE